MVLCHSIPLYKLQGSIELSGYIDLKQGTANIEELFLIVCSHVGQIGNALFIVPSAYFLLNSNEVRKNKIVQFVLDTFIVSVCYLLVFAILLEDRLPVRFVVNALFPTTSLFYWFVTCYILIYAVHPWLNLIVKKLERKQLFTTNLCLFVLYCCISFALGGKYYYSQLLGFVVYYFFVAYVKLYLPNLSRDKRFNIKVFWLSLGGFIALLVVANYLGVFVNAAAGLVGRIETFMNPFIFGIAISTFNLCNRNIYYNKIINKVASTSLLVFVISNNQLVCFFAKPLLFDYIYRTFSYEYIAVICIVLATITLVISVCLSLLYMKSIRRIVDKCCGKIVSVYDVIVTKIYILIENVENGKR